MGHVTDRSDQPRLLAIVPVLGRPERVQPLVESLGLSTVHERAEGWDVRTVFVCSWEDHGEVRAVRAIGARPLIVDWPAGHGDYARKVNRAADLHPYADWLLLGADDLRFHPGWLRAAISTHIATGALVIGTNDLGNPLVMRGGHATHSLVHRDYVAQGTIDEPGKLLHEGYGHNWVDNEFVETARARDMFAFAAGAHVEHLHPIWRKADDDATYRRGQVSYREDQRLYQRRRRLWQRVAA